MREYSEEKMSSYLKTLQNAADSVSSVDYMSSIKNQYVLDKRYYIKNQAYVTSNQAYNRVVYIRKRLDDLYDIMARFKRDVDAKTEEIYAITEKLLSLIEDNNRALTSICDVLRGVGDFKGKVATPSALVTAGFDEAKNSALHNEVWNLLFVKFFDPYCLPSDKAINAYVESLKNKVANGIALTDEEKTNLANIYKGMVLNRFGDTGDITDMSDLALQNCVDVFELLYPHAKEVLDEFFMQATSLNDANVNLNVLRIKYTLYTSDPELRDVMLYYIEDSGLKFVAMKDKGFYSPGEETIYLDLFKNDNGAKNCYAFFHELGHAIDDLSCFWGQSSEVLPEYIKDDVSKQLKSDITEFNKTLPGFETLSEHGINSVVDYFLDATTNPNAVLLRGNEPNVPDNWTPGQVKAYKYILSLYGYQEYVFNDFHRYEHGGSSSLTKGSNNGGILIDVLGGVTNNKIGGVSGGHPYALEDVRPSTYEDFKKKVNESSYYYGKGEIMYDTELYAEVFEYKVLGIDLSTTKRVLDSSVKKVEDMINGLYKHVP